MDHLKLPEGAKPFIVVAYDGEEKDYYEKLKGKDFFTFPQSQGWTDDDVDCRPRQTGDLMGGTVEGEEKKTRQPWEIEKFFQTWLFFGLIIEVFTLVGISITTSDFLVPFTQKTLLKPQVSHIVSTEILPEKIREWRESFRTSRNSENFDKIMQLLDYVGNVVDSHCSNSKTHRSPGQYGKVTWPVKDEITTSIIAVAAMLRKAARSIYNRPKNGERWPVTNSEILRLRIQRKWCRSDAAMIMEDFDVDGQYYIAAAESQPPEKLDTHYACTDQSCEAKIADGTYVIQHARGCVGDDYEPIPKFLGHLEPTYGKSPDTVRQAIMDIYDAQDLPFLRWDFEQHGLVTFGHKEDRYAEGADKIPPYVAISHVWANGMGNPFDNSLPYCQLEWIQKLVDDLCLNHVSKASDQKPGFWMDILCCLVGNDKKSQDYKKSSIASMRKIYAEAVAVLIIDPWLMAVPSTADMSEVCVRVYAAAWSRRLWTHQEGFLGKDVYYQFQDKPVAFGEVNKLAEEYQERLARQGYPITFPLEASSKTSFYYTGIKDFIRGISDGHFQRDQRWIVYQHLAKSLGYRATTKVSDELLCIASIIGLTVKDYTGIEESNEERLAELRMEAFLHEIGRFRQGIIFNSYRRLTIPGFRWAPLSLLGHRSSGLGDLDGSPDAAIKDFSDRTVNDKYVEVSALGGKLNTKINLTKHMTKTLGLNNKKLLEMTLGNGKTVLLPTVGLPVDYPGYTIKFLPNEHGLTVNMAERRFGLKYSPVRKVASFVKPPPMPKVPSFGKVPTLGKSRLGGFGSAHQAAAEQAAPAAEAATDTVAEIVSYEYVVHVADNDVQWDYDRNYTIILQKDLGDGSGTEFLAMVGLMSVGPGDRYWVQSLCSAVIRAWGPGDDPKIKAGIDMMDVSEAKTNWVVT
ncbi:hypothetical protein EV356DRAFT_533150 [Viridothelium virens]|uniref:Heterokaryon incompatibility domain-containing protein n=1 Tax=Viridothelium virens TaxID=1048519 RepID=A0A6A6H8E2_VIRVR|nr:hypothetical protein EV356DRAFT_533150 [Viridothelium virens]